MPALRLRGEHVTLAQAIKAAGFAETGGHAKALVREGVVTVNGQVETRPGRKLFSGDRFGVRGETEWTVSHG
ncbi:MAG TPA: RNA-binding S4 domain-containing protein [Gemmataceae bacterium]|nr:RNA-binding S4 domain-containing protein [Gemmataceae bacterium]